MMLGAQYLRDLWNALHSNAADEVDVDVQASVLPTGAATSANQTTANTLLGQIEDLRDALQSRDTDALQVRGENQLFSFRTQYLDIVSNTNAAAGGNTLSALQVPANEIWVITSVLGRNFNTGVSRLYLQVYDGAVDYQLEVGNALGVNEPVTWTGHTYLESGDRVRAYFAGCNAGDDIYLYVHGYKMDAE